jgi:hypothetical protein
MLIKAGVDISRLERHTRRSLNVVALIFSEERELFVITSTYEGNHGEGSLHYANQAYDVRLPDDSRLRIFAKIKEKLGPDFDVILGATYYHIEYDPK